MTFYHFCNNATVSTGADKLGEGPTLTEHEPLPELEARFWGQDPRFAVIGDEHYPVLLKSFLQQDQYTEQLEDFDGYPKQFFALAERRAQAVLVDDGDGVEFDDDADWTMDSLRELSDVELSGGTFKCCVGKPLAKVTETGAP